MGRVKRNARSKFRSPERTKHPKGHAPVNWGPGRGDYERPLREGAHRSRPPAILSYLSDRSERYKLYLSTFACEKGSMAL